MNIETVTISKQTANVALAIMQGVDVPFSIGMAAMKELIKQLQAEQKKESAPCTAPQPQS